MSKSLNLLKQAEAIRASKYSQALNKAAHNKTNSENSVSENLVVSSTVSNTKKAAWPIALFIPTAFLLLLALNLTLFITVHRNFSRTNNAFAKLKVIQDSLNSNANQIVALGSSLKEINQNFKKTDAKIENAGKKISQLEKLSDANAQSIDNLTKAKNTLFNKASSLEADLIKLKTGTSANN